MTKKLYQVKVAKRSGDDPEVFFIETDTIDLAMDRSMDAYSGDAGTQLPGMEDEPLIVVVSAKEVSGRIIR